MKSLVINKLHVDKELVGYRVGIYEDGNKLQLIDIPESKVVYFLKIVGCVEIRRGRILQGKILNGVFLTGYDDNVIGVTTKQEVDVILKEYFYRTDSQILNLLGSIGISDMAKAECIVTGFTGTLENSFYGRFKKVKKSREQLIFASCGIKRNLVIREFQNSKMGYVEFGLAFVRFADAFRVFYNYGQLKGLGVCELDVETSRGTVKVEVDFNWSLDYISRRLKSYVDITDYDISYRDKVDFYCCRKHDKNLYVVIHTIFGPGADELMDIEDSDMMYESYGLEY